jgi:hypothetical protein
MSMAAIKHMRGSFDVKRAKKKENKARSNMLGKYRLTWGSKRKRARKRAIELANNPKMPGPARIGRPGSFSRIFGASRQIGGLTEIDCFGTMHSPEDTPPNMCPCFSDNSREQVKDRTASVWPDENLHVRRRKLECPFCKRRVLARIGFGHDGDVLAFLMPVHKPKHWWKKKVKRPMRDKRCGRRR